MATDLVNRITTAPAGMPFDFDEIKEHIRVDHEIEDAVLKTYILAAIDYVEKFTWRKLRPTTYTGYADSWDTFNIQLHPVTSITSVKYYDAANSLQTMSASDYQTDLISIPASINFLTTYSVFDRPNAIQIEFVSGYADLYAIPSGLVSGLYLMIGHLFDNRNSTSMVKMHTLPIGLHDILAQYNARTL
jgi:uncharacterized phiE125 gp8 family phage protein